MILQRDNAPCHPASIAQDTITYYIHWIWSLLIITCSGPRRRTSLNYTSLISKRYKIGWMNGFGRKTDHFIFAVFMCCQRDDQKCETTGGQHFEKTIAKVLLSYIPSNFARFTRHPHHNISFVSWRSFHSKASHQSAVDLNTWILCLYLTQERSKCPRGPLQIFEAGWHRGMQAIARETFYLKRISSKFWILDCGCLCPNGGHTQLYSSVCFSKNDTRGNCQKKYLQNDRSRNFFGNKGTGGNWRLLEI